MQIRDLLPIIIPGVLLQIWIQVYYIRHCWRNERLSAGQKLFFISAIVLCNLPAAAVYLFFNREKAEESREDFQGIDMDASVRQGIFVLLIAAFEIFMVRALSQNIEGPYYYLIISLLAYSFIIMLINNLLMEDRPRLLYYLLPGLQLLLAVPVIYLDNSGNGQFILLIVAAGIINKFPLSLARIYSIASFCAALAGGTARAVKDYGDMGFQDAFRHLYINALIFLLVLAAFYALKRQLLTNRQLNAALHRIYKQSRQLERMSALAERSRLTAEIHDTVGHALTGAVIAIEAAESVLTAENQDAAQKLALAKQQVKLGLDSMRSSVRAIRREENQAFAPALKGLLEDIRRTTGLAVSSIVDLPADLLTIQQNILLQAVKECATNSLKHGRSTEADLLVQVYKGDVRLTFSDNGEGADPVVFGFGLSSMRERIESIGGTLSADSAGGEGFTVSISIPIGLEQEERQHE